MFALAPVATAAGALCAVQSYPQAPLSSHQLELQTPSASQAPSNQAALEGKNSHQHFLAKSNQGSGSRFSYRFNLSIE